MPFDCDILCFSTSDWHGIWGSRQQLMLRFAQRGYRVLFIERPVGLEHLLRYHEFRQRKIQRWREGMRQIAENIWIVSLPPLLPGGYYAQSVNSLNQRLTKIWTQPYLRRFKPRSLILWLYHPGQGNLIGQFGEIRSVYHCIDEWTAGTTGRKRKTIATIEQNLLKRVDIVFANSPPTFENKRRFNPHTYRVPSGVEVEFFAQHGNPHPILKDIPQPRIGYSGHINDRLNYALLTDIVRQRPDWSFVFAGSTHPWTLQTPQLAHLNSFPNVYFVGKLPYQEMPALLNGLDVGIIPYINDDRGYYRSPLKLYEYLAAGKAVVSVAHPESNEFDNIILVADTPEQFLQAIAQALRDNTPVLSERRLQVAQQHSWENRVDYIERILESYEPTTP